MSQSEVKRGRRLLFGRALGLTAASVFPLSARLAGSGSEPASGDLVPPWTKTQGHPILTPAYGERSKYEAAVVRVPIPGRVNTLTAASLTPLQDQRGIVTPSGLVFERHHAGVPDIPPERHRLLVHGLVERPLTFTMDDVMRFPSVSRFHFLECSGNSAGEWKRRAATSKSRTGCFPAANGPASPSR